MSCPTVLAASVIVKHALIASTRVCPGRYFADDLLYITAACALHVFRFEPPLDEQGRPIKIELQESHGLIS